MENSGIKSRLLLERRIEKPLNDKNTALVVIRGDFDNFRSVFSYTVTIMVSMEESHYCLVSYSFPKVALNQAIALFENKEELLRQIPLLEAGEVFPLGFTNSEISFISNKTLHCGSHYDYLNIMLEPFWLEVFGKTASEIWCGGIVGAHGDKCRGYNRDWEANGINKYRGSLIFLLAYTSECRNDMASVDQWVIDNYNKYLPAIIKTEESVLADLASRVRSA